MLSNKLPRCPPTTAIATTTHTTLFGTISRCVVIAQNAPLLGLQERAAAAEVAEQIGQTGDQHVHRRDGEVGDIRKWNRQGGMRGGARSGVSVSVVGGAGWVGVVFWFYTVNTNKINST